MLRHSAARRHAAADINMPLTPAIGEATLPLLRRHCHYARAQKQMAAIERAAIMLSDAYRLML